MQFNNSKYNFFSLGLYCGETKWGGNDCTKDRNKKRTFSWGDKRQEDIKVGEY